MRALVITGPDDLRARFGDHTTTLLVKETAAMRPRAGDVVGSRLASPYGNSVGEPNSSATRSTDSTT